MDARVVRAALLAVDLVFGGDARLARLPLADAALPGAPLARIGRAIRASEREIAANPRARSATLRVAERTTHAIPPDFDRLTTAD